MTQSNLYCVLNVWSGTRAREFLLLPYFLNVCEKENIINERFTCEGENEEIGAFAENIY